MSTLVVSANINDTWRYAETAAEISELIRAVVDEPQDGPPSFLYVSDKPYVPDPTGPLPPHELRVSTEPHTGYGALHFWLRTDENAITGWDSFNPNVTDETPQMWFDVQGPTPFRRNASLPLNLVRAAVLEFASTREMPRRIQWQDAAYY